MPSPFEITSVRCDDETFVTVVGELDLSTVPQLQDALSRVSANGATVVLDLTRLEFIDSSGIRALLLAHQASQRDGFDLRITRSSDKVMSALELVDLVDELPFIEDP